jgi:hypothetical protein
MMLDCSVELITPLNVPVEVKDPDVAETFKI